MIENEGDLQKHGKYMIFSAQQVHFDYSPAYASGLKMLLAFLGKLVKGQSAKSYRKEKQVPKTLFIPTPNAEN